MTKTNDQQSFYPNIESNVDFASIERKIIKYWQENNIFELSIDNRSAKQSFTFYDGPPFANGLPHYGHLLTGFIKDVYARYQTQMGKRVERKFGWDCHGLPAEMQAEKELGITGRVAITEYGIDKFNAHCRESVMKYTNEWEQYVSRQARWVDFRNSYKTMDTNYMESVLWAFKELYNKGLVYQSMRVMPYSWACETPLSNFETRLDNSYRERADNSVSVSFVLQGKPEFLPDCGEYRILAWTTTPWTLPSNLALAVGPDMDYVTVVKDKICYIIAHFAIGKYAKELGVTEDLALKPFKGKELIGISYQPLFDYFKDHKNAFRILAGDFVSEGDGTGVVHIAPGFGEDDQILCEQNDIKLVCPVDNAGKFTSEIPDLQGLQVFDANDKIIIKLKNQGNWLKTEQYLHNYPHCWRTDTPLIYKAVPSWYVKVTQIKDRMVELNQQINWIPFGVRDNLFGKWLENARDWSISRNRFWGTPIPIWQSDNPKYPRTDVYGSIEELEKDFKVKIDDLHKPFIDQLTRPNPDDPSGKSVMRRVEDVFDCWFESGSMPYGQAHYPFENKTWFEQNFPADFIVEYSAQTRGWFYTLMVLSTALFDRPPFLNCICHGVILDASGQKLSKRLNNYADPLELFDKYGSDALRATMLSSNVVKGQELLIDKEGKMVFDQLRLFIKPIWNAYHFFCLYANSDHVRAETTYKSDNILDDYILSKLKIAINKIKQGLDNFDTQGPYNAIGEFFEVLNNWYIRRSRNRFWRAEKDHDKITAYNILYSCLNNMAKAMAPLLPLLAEEIYLGLNDLATKKQSVHLTDFPTLENIIVNEQLVSDMDKVLDICSSALFVRSEENIRVRQPLQDLTIIAEFAEKFHSFADLIKDEINVKNIIYQNDVTEFATPKLIINFAAVGKRLPAKMKDIIKSAKQNDWQIKDDKLYISEEILSEDEYSLILEPKIKNGVKVLRDNKSMIKLNLEITEKLKEEGVARDIIRQIQQARKEASFDIADRIYLRIEADARYQQIVEKYRNFIEEQTLSQIKQDFTSFYSTEFELDKKIRIDLAKT